MVNEDIVTSLRNAVERGESLENAIRMLINSGYPSNEVQDASKFVGFFPVQGSKNNLNTNQNILIKSGSIKPPVQQTITGASFPPRLPPPNIPLPVQSPQISYPTPRYPSIQQLPPGTPSSDEIKTEISRPLQQMQTFPTLQPRPSQSPSSIQQQIPRYPSINEPSAVAQEVPKKPGYKKEILLLVVLLLLIGVLIATILLRDNILAFFS